MASKRGRPSLCGCIHGARSCAKRFALSFRGRFNHRGISTAINNRTSHFRAPGGPSKSTSPNVRLASRPRASLAARVAASALRTIGSVLCTPGTHTKFVNHFACSCSRHCLLRFLNHCSNS